MEEHASWEVKWETQAGLKVGMVQGDLAMVTYGEIRFLNSEVTNRYELSIYLIYKLKHVLRMVKVSWICHGCRKNGTLGNLGKKNRRSRTNCRKLPNTYFIAKSKT